MMNVYDDLAERGSVRQTNSQNQCEDPNQRFQTAYNEIPICPTVDWCQAAAFRFNLPGCEAQGQRNEYLAFIIPRKKTENKPPPAKPIERQEQYEEPVRTDQYVPQHISNCRWSTEYRSTIDDCARRVMHTQQKRKRSPIYPKKCCLSNVPPRPLSPCLQTQKSRPIVPKNECFPVVRTKDICRARTPPRLRSKPVQTRQKITECDRPLMIEPPVARPIAYDNCYKEEAPEMCDNSSNQRPMRKCKPSEETLSRDTPAEHMQRSTARPMPRCIFQSCD